MFTENVKVYNRSQAEKIGFASLPSFLEPRASFSDPALEF
jgi:hypothetical protein